MNNIIQESSNLFQEISNLSISDLFEDDISNILEVNQDKHQIRIPEILINTLNIIPSLKLISHEKSIQMRKGFKNFIIGDPSQLLNIFKTNSQQFQETIFNNIGNILQKTPLEHIKQITDPNNKNIKIFDQYSNIVSILNSSISIEEKKVLISNLLTQIFNSQAASLLFLDDRNEQLYFYALKGDNVDFLNKIHIPRGVGIASWVAENKTATIVNDVQNDPRFYKGVDKKSGFVTKNMICVPIISQKGKLIGVIQIMNKLTGNYTAQDLNFLQTIGNNIGLSIQFFRSKDKFNRLFSSTISTLVETIGKRDYYTKGHSERVRYFSILIGKKLGLSDKELVDLTTAAELHDIGKIGVRDDILLKQGPLNDEEFINMKLHTEIGGDIMEQLENVKEEIIAGITCHHERFDGKGYPNGLAGENIHIFARIIGVADAYDAMRTDRPYRKGLSIEVAMAELTTNKGKQFDPIVVEAFLKCLTDNTQSPIE